MIEAKDIPQPLIDKIRERFEREPRVRLLRMQQQLHQRGGNFTAALRLAQTADEMFARCVSEYVAEAERQVSSISPSQIGMSEADESEITRLMLVCFMCADVIESAIIDMDDIVRSYDKTARMDMFDDMRDLMRLSKEKLAYLRENSGYMDGMVFADKSDNLYAMAKSKASSVMRKIDDKKKDNQ